MIRNDELINVFRVQSAHVQQCLVLSCPVPFQIKLWNIIVWLLILSLLVLATFLQQL